MICPTCSRSIPDGLLACAVCATEHREHSIDPETGIWPIREWGAACGRGFVSAARFGANSQVIPRTNRNTSRKWRKLSK